MYDRFRFEHEVLIPSTEGEVESEGSSRGWGESDVAALVTVEPPAKVRSVASAAR